MKIVVIGATGHIGTYLVPRLVQAGHDVVALSRGTREPYRDPGIWKLVERRRIDRGSEEAAGSFARTIAAEKPDVVMDLICFTRESAQHLVEGLKGAVGHYLLCGTIWVHGPSGTVPTTEETPRKPFGDYGIRKAAIERWLLEKARRDGFPATILHPGHIVGEGWVPVNPAGNFNPAVFRTLQEGGSLKLPNLGMETVHHVHADDVAQAFCKAMELPGAAIGESFHVVSPAALTLRGYAEGMARWFGTEASLEFLPWEKWRASTAPRDADATWDHIAHSPNCSIEKARRLLGFAPRYGSLQAVCESVDWLVEHGWRTKESAS
jgi:nucleoside-diphosphate-sugar epimerase